MLRKVHALFIALPAVLLSTPGQAGHPQVFYDHARVVRVKPIIELVDVATPRRECWDEVHAPRRDDSYTGLILGGILGGAVGSQVGHGSGRTAATLAGTVLGASIANDIRGNRRRYESEAVHRCRVVDEYYQEEKIVGYRVKYRYQGQLFVTRMDYDPGDEVRVRVSVALAE